MQVKLPEKRQRREGQEYFTLNKMFYDKALRQQVCVVNAIGYRRLYYIPFEFLSEENKLLIENNNKQSEEKPKAVPKSKPQEVKNEKSEKKEPAKGKRRSERKEPSSEVKEKQNSILGMMKDVYRKGNHLLDKPAKIIGCHWRDSLHYSVLFNCKQQPRNASTIPHEVMIEKFPELLIEFLAKTSIKFLDN